MSCKVLQRLLSSGEYDELEDVVISEGEFIEADEQHNPLRQIILGMTPFNLIVAERYITNYKEHPEVYFLTEVDLYMDDLEVSSVWPVCLLRIDYSRRNYELSVRLCDRTRYYELTNTRLNGDLEDTWARWLERVTYLKEDPYGYIRAQFDEYNIPYPEYYTSLPSSRDQKADDSRLLEMVSLDDIEMLDDLVRYEPELQNLKQDDYSTPDKKQHKITKMMKWFKNDTKD